MQESKNIFHLIEVRTLPVSNWVKKCVTQSTHYYTSKPGFKSSSSFPQKKNKIK